MSCKSHQGEPYPAERTETNHQVVERHYGGSVQHTHTEIWKKNEAGCTTKGGYSYVSDGERYDFYGRHVGSAE